MAGSSEATKRTRLVTAPIILAVIIVAVAALLTTSYMAAVTVLAGMVLAWLIYAPVRLQALRLRSKSQENASQLRRSVTPRFVLGFSAILLGLCAFLIFFAALLSLPAIRGAVTPGSLPYVPGAATVLGVQSYRATIEPVDSNLRKFTIQEQFLLEPSVVASVHLTTTVVGTTRSLTGHALGFLVEEAEFLPSGIAATHDVTIPLPYGYGLLRLACTFDCPKSEIEVRNLPKGSFYLAYFASELQTYPYVNVESIKWSMNDVREGVRFAYVQPPYQELRPILQPFFGLATLGQWLLAILGLAAGLVTVYVVRPLSDLAKTGVTSLLARKMIRKRDNTSSSSPPGR
jgi:hypothetical protein